MKIFSPNRPVVLQEKQAPANAQPIDENAETELVVKNSIHPLKTTTKPIPNIEALVENSKTPVTVIETPKPDITVNTPKIDYNKIAKTAGIVTIITVVAYFGGKKILTYFK